MLKSAGYVTANFGKWHIGKDPKTQGIDHNIGGSNKGNPGKDGYFSPYKIDFIKNETIKKIFFIFNKRGFVVFYLRSLSGIRP